jgi:SAM-dependent methyltransferase
MNGGQLSRQAERAAPASFGAGNGEPYDHALRRGHGTLHLHRVTGGIRRTDAGVWRIDVERFLAPADAGDLAAIANIDGPVLDIGCGPGRMVKAAIDQGHLTLGIDVSTAAVSIARDQGLPVMRTSVFDPIPAEGTWGTVLLFDGNIGIGGDPRALLERCWQLLRPGGRILIETHADPDRDVTISGVLVDDFQRASLPFPWTEVGSRSLRADASAAGLAVTREWTAAGRSFVEYERP